MSTMWLLRTALSWCHIKSISIYFVIIIIICAVHYIWSHSAFPRNKATSSHFCEWSSFDSSYIFSWTFQMEKISCAITLLFASIIAFESEHAVELMCFACLTPLKCQIVFLSKNKLASQWSWQTIQLLSKRKASSFVKSILYCSE